MNHNHDKTYPKGQLATISDVKNNTLTKMINADIFKNYFNSKQLEMNGVFPTIDIPPTLNIFCGNILEIYTPYGTYSRASSGLSMGLSGFLEPTYNNILRKEWDKDGNLLGWLFEEQRTNLLTYSENFENVAWIKNSSYIVPNVCLAPDGTYYGTKLIEDTASSNHFVYQQPTVNIGTTYTFSVYAKASERNFVCVETYNGSSYPLAYFNLSNGTIGTHSGCSPKIQNVGNGWYRCTITFTHVSGTTCFVYVLSAIADNAQSYTGDGISGIYIFGSQLEVGLWASSYIPSAKTWTSRGTPASYISDGLINYTTSSRSQVDPIKSYNSNSSKLLLENAATNLVLYSEQLDNPSWGKTLCSITPNAINGLDGTLSADKLIATNVSGTHYISSTFAASNTYYTASVFVKSLDSTNKIQLQLSDYVTSVIRATYDLSLGTATITTYMSPWTNVSARIEYLTDNWYRIQLTGKRGQGSTGSLDIICADSTGNPTMTGDGVSGIYLFGAQVEVGNYATSYIKTGYEATSTTSQIIATGSKTFITNTNASYAWMGFTASAPITIFQTTNPANFMIGTVTSHSNTTLVANITSIGGSGTFTNWTIQSGLSVTRAADVGSSSQTTRVADNWLINTSSFSFNPNEGTIFVICDTQQPNNINQSAAGAALCYSPTNYLETGMFGWQNYFGSYGNNGTAITTLLQTNFTSNITYKFALAYKNGDIASCINGGNILTSTSNIPYMNTLSIGSLLGSYNFLNGHVKHFAYFPKRLSNSDLQYITS